MKIVECVPNFSEGRRKEVLDAIVDAITGVEGIKLLGREMDADHNRAVITFIGEPEQVKRAAFNGIAKASELIDLNIHEGEHPRIGAADVVPFVPIQDVSVAECVELAKALGAEVAEELGIPVYLYEKAATSPERENLAKIRKGQFEGLKTAIAADPARAPDYGPPQLHPTAGATVIGVREPLIAYNINLGTDDVEIAQKIAKAVRHISGGLRYVKALGFEIKERGIVQVSMNLTNYKKTPVFRVFEMVKSEAERYGVPVIGSELIGLIPLDAIVAVADHYLRFEEFKAEQVLERKIWD
jgi:glutamate formiminotransferase